MCLSDVDRNSQVVTYNYIVRDRSRYGLQWETLHCNAVFHWLSPYTEWSLNRGRRGHCIIGQDVLPQDFSLYPRRKIGVQSFTIALKLDRRFQTPARFQRDITIWALILAGWYATSHHWLRCQDVKWIDYISLHLSWLKCSGIDQPVYGTQCLFRVCTSINKICNVTDTLSARIINTHTFLIA